MQLEPPDVLCRRRVGRSLEECSEPLTAVNVAPLGAGTEPTRVHVLDHPLTQRRDGIRAHGELLSGTRLTTPRFSRQGTRARHRHLDPRYRSRKAEKPPASAAIAKRFSALAHRCNVKFVTALSLSGEKRQAQRHR